MRPATWSIAEPGPRCCCVTPAARWWWPSPAGWWRCSGVRDMIVVDTPDAVLVCGRKQAQDIKSIVDELKRRGDQHLT